METNSNIQDKIDLVLNSADTINETHISPFFKDKTMQRLFAEREVKTNVWSWFTPKIQLATLVCVLFFNVYAVREIKTTNYNESMSSFASDYGLTIESETSLFN
ncbi:hypothetical protein ES692_01910 [Psychroserpens burtonensis]|uniref:Uncharacterized protein n=1 Tax=Psychroserpens burtonensis TaxID=49278 RepID=A0A5C7BKJ2_9FLAO|nr:hypothetical protein [Psychroserpens burtonensis]TXE20038.1 hypothetical protein ES692_01910 [Psychroserpens burtonensis]